MLIEVTTPKLIVKHIAIEVTKASNKVTLT
jgi:hypothetical protein